MIKFLNNARTYTNRDYLSQFYNQDILVVNDNDLENYDQCRSLLSASHHIKIILDITHNPVRHWPIELAVSETLTNNIEYYYHPCARIRFFPLFLWAYSLRHRVWWPNLPIFDNPGVKTQSMMCLNNNPKYHRTRLRQHLLPVIDKIIYTIDGQGLPGEDLKVTANNVHGINDIGIGHEVYNQCAVNIVTETITEHAYISEKTCKPFLACQIPIIVGGAGITRFLHNVGLDMFGDIIPWHTWDDEPVMDIRIQKIAEFVQGWINQGTVLQDYQRVQHRVEHNKAYFHSEQFRDRIMWQMQN